MQQGYKIGSLLIAAAVVGIFPSCSKPKQAPPRIVPVVTATAGKQTVPLQLKEIGNVESYNAVSIKPLVAGTVEGVYFQEGQDVQKGDLLFKIDPAPYAAALRQAEATLAKDIAQAKNAEEQAKRYAILVQKDYVSRDQYDQLRANADAMAALADADRANVENAKLQLEYCTIKAPISGRAGSVLVNNGNVIKANEAVLTTINQVKPIYVSFSIPEQNLADVKKYSATGDLKVDAVIPGDDSRPARGGLTFIDNSVDRTTGTIRLKGTFENRDHRLWPGQFVDVILTLTMEQDRIVVPSQAVQTGQQGQYVYVIKDDNTADIRLVKQGRTFDKWAIIDSGVAAGENVVIDGQLRLVPGSKVEIKGPAAAETVKSSVEAKQETNQKTERSK